MEVWIKCKRELNGPRALLFLERLILLKKIGRPPRSQVAWLPVEVWVECKIDLNASRALLVLEHIILLKRIGCPRGVW